VSTSLCCRSKACEV